MIVREDDAGPMAGWLRASARDTDQTDALIDVLRDLLA